MQSAEPQGLSGDCLRADGSSLSKAACVAERAAFALHGRRRPAGTGGRGNNAGPSSGRGGEGARAGERIRGACRARWPELGADGADHPGSPGR